LPLSAVRTRAAAATTLLHGGSVQLVVVRVVN
jgi:hypothetical protein